jgi:hypothetical protein
VHVRQAGVVHSSQQVLCDDRLRWLVHDLLEAARVEIAPCGRGDAETLRLEEPFALWPRMQVISLEVVMRAVFGDASGERLARLRVNLVELTSWMNSPRRLDRS